MVDEKIPAVTGGGEAGRTDRKGTGDGGVWGGARRLGSGGVKETGSCSLRGEALIHNSPPMRTFIHILTPPPQPPNRPAVAQWSPSPPLPPLPISEWTPPNAPWWDAPLAVLLFFKKSFFKKSFSLLETVVARKKNPRMRLSLHFLLYFLGVRTLILPPPPHL